jgi:hypothetical protein
MQFQHFAVSICSINEMKFIVVDDTSNRLHCNLTNIDKLRKFLTIEGERLAQDISNLSHYFGHGDEEQCNCRS